LQIANSELNGVQKLKPETIVCHQKVVEQMKIMSLGSYSKVVHFVPLTCCTH